MRRPFCFMLHASLRLAVALLLVDALALAGLRACDAALLLRVDAAAGAGLAFRALVAGFALFATARFVRRQRTGLHALLDALVLTHVARDVGFHALVARRIRIGVGLRVVLLRGDVLADLLLRLVDALLLGG